MTLDPQRHRWRSAITKLAPITQVALAFGHAIVAIFDHVHPVGLSATAGFMAAERLPPRQNDSRFQLLVRYGIAISFYHVACLVELRTKRLTLAVLPRENIRELNALPLTSRIPASPFYQRRRETGDDFCYGNNVVQADLLAMTPSV